MPHSKRKFTLAVNRRELATILAALRFYQDENLQISPDIPDQVIKDIATDCGSLRPLNFSDVSRLCERMNLCNEACAGRHKQRVWVLIVMDKGTVVHVRICNSQAAAEKGLVKYLREDHGYEGQEDLEAVSEWIEQHGQCLGVDIVPQDIEGRIG